MIPEDASTAGTTFPAMKRCATCKQFFPRVEFPLRKDSQDGRRSSCRECTNRSGRLSRRGERVIAEIPEDGQEMTILEKARRVDLGIAIAHCHARRGVPMSAEEIAAFCGCSRANIQQIEERAIRKLRKELERCGLWEAFQLSIGAFVKRDAPLEFERRK